MTPPPERDWKYMKKVKEDPPTCVSKPMGKPWTFSSRKRILNTKGTDVFNGMFRIQMT